MIMTMNPYDYKGIDGQIYNTESGVNQRIRGRLVDRDVYVNITDIMLSIGEDDEDWGDLAFENPYGMICPECEELIGYGPITSFNLVCPHCGRTIPRDEVVIDYPDKLQYWIVSEWLGERLIDRHEMVMRRELGYIWVRQAFGQSILMDDVIGDIARADGILEGQRYSWEHKCA